MAKINPSLFPLCWKGCGKLGSFIHIWRKCPHVKNFWNRVFPIISAITGQSLSPNPAPALLSLDMDLGSTLHHSQVVGSLLTTA
uniref:Uncharacterized protein n=1 Tax=Podarcis muralis TaxID=64176 RepID=A0A670HQD1_PODMU